MMSKMSERYAEMAAAAEMSAEFRAEIDHWKTRADEAERLLEEFLVANIGLAEQCELETSPFADEADTLPAIMAMGDVVIKARAFLGGKS